MENINDILKTINDAEEQGIDTLGTQNVKRWLESVQKFQNNEDNYSIEAFKFHFDGLKTFIKGMRVNGFLGTSPQKQEDLDMQNDIQRQLEEIKIFVDDVNKTYK